MDCVGVQTCLRGDAWFRKTQITGIFWCDLA